MSTTSSPINTEQGAHVPYVRAIRAHPIVVVGIAVVAVVAAIAWQKTRSTSYKATTQVLMTAVNNGGPYVGLPVVVESSNFPSRTLQTATSVLKSPAVAYVVAKHLGGHWTGASVGEAISVQPLGESNIVSITGTAGTGKEAATLANTYTREALSLHITQLSNEAKAEIAQLQAEKTSGEAAAQVATQLAALNAVAAGHDPNFTLLQLSTPPPAASGSSTKLIALLALLAGLIVGIGAATAIEYLNRRVRDEAELISLYPLPVLVRVPVLPRGAREATAFELMAPRVREAFRTLQVQLPTGERGSDGRVVMFTSASPQDGKTASAIDFALVLSAAGYQVILLDFDLRKPDIGGRLGVAYANHLDFAREEIALDDVLVDVPSAPGLRIVGSPRHGSATPLLDSSGRRLPALLREAREAADYVIIDTPPIGQVSDALVVAMAADDIIVVSRTGSTDREELQHTRELLERMSLVPAGLLVIGETGASDVYAEYGGVAQQAERKPARSAKPQPRPHRSPSQRVGGELDSGSLERPRPRV